MEQPDILQQMEEALDSELVLYLKMLDLSEKTDRRD